MAMECEVMDSPLQQHQHEGKLPPTHKLRASIDTVFRSIYPCRQSLELGKEIEHLAHAHLDCRLLC
jgi:hypothetical protein